MHKSSRSSNTLSHSHTPGRHAQIRARICTYSEVCTLTLEHVIYLCACLGVGGKFRLINTDREICAQEQQKVQYSCSLLHAVEVCVNARTYMHIFRGMYTNLGTCDLLVRMLRSWGKFRLINTGREACAQEQQEVQYSLSLSHAGEA